MKYDFGVGYAFPKHFDFRMSIKSQLIGCNKDTRYV